MSRRFRKTIKLLPGLRLNLSKSGVSASVGKAGATVNVSEKGVRGTVGLPGTGISYSDPLSARAVKPSRFVFLVVALAAAVGLALLVL